MVCIISHGLFIIYLITNEVYTAKVTSFTIGSLLSNENMIKIFESSMNKENIKYKNMNIKFQVKAELMASRALKAAEQVCNLIKATRKRMFALIVSHPPNNPDIPPLSASFTCAFYSIPVIGISARQSAFSDKYSHSSFLRTVPPYSEEARVWTEMIREFQWREISLVHSDDQEGKTLLSRLERESDDNKPFRITRTVSFPADEDEDIRTNFTELLRPIRQEQTRAIILYAKQEFAKRILDAADKLNMLGKDWAWIVTEQVLKMENPPQGLIGLQLAHASESEHIIDAVSVVTRGIAEAYIKDKVHMSVINAPENCSINPYKVSTQIGRSTINWLDKAKDLYESIKNVEVENGKTGRVKFDDKGDRVMPVYDIMNVHESKNKVTLVKVGTYGKKRKMPEFWDPKDLFIELLQLNMSMIIWPGNSKITRKKEFCVKRDNQNDCILKEMGSEPAAPKSFMKKTHLKVVTKVSVPFVLRREIKEGEKCDNSSNPLILRKEVPCRHTNSTTKEVKYYCCSGYCIDLLRRLANRTLIEENFTPFTYELHLVGDGDVGIEKIENETKRWTGMVGELLTGEADLAVAPMTITPERAARVEFTKPFKYLGLTILVKREHSKSNLASFLQPFENTLWVLVALSVHVVALVLYLLDRFSPFGRFKLAKSTSTEEDALNLSSAMWFAWGVLLNSGIGEGTPRSFSARVLGMVWAGFAMIIVASYTANLAAFLVLDRPEASISGIDDARLRNPQKDFKFATVKNSPVEQYFKRQVEYATMYRTMESYNVEDADIAIKQVKDGVLKAFIWDSARISYEASRTCDLITAGEVFGRNGYGLAMKKDNPWLYEMSQAVLNFHERGFMESLDSKWILVKAEGCDRTESSPATLGLTNMAGVFIMVAAGIVAGVFLIFIEIAYKKRRGLKEKELELAKNAVDRWRSNIEKRKILRKTLSAESDFHRYFNSLKGVEMVGDSSEATGSLLLAPHANNISLLTGHKDTRIFFDNEIQV